MHPCKVVDVDDEPITRLDMIEMLQQVGFQVRNRLFIKVNIFLLHSNDACIEPSDETVCCSVFFITRRRDVDEGTMDGDCGT